jgi:uncharacterized protein
MFDHGLSESHVGILRRILLPYASSINRVGLFGSRATGKYRSNSDIDMVIYGPMDQDAINSLKTQFDESYLPVKVDLVIYHLITYPALKEHIDRVMKPLFSGTELLQAHLEALEKQEKLKKQEKRA